MVSVTHPPTKLDDRQNRLRDVAEPGRLTVMCCRAIMAHGMTGSTVRDRGQIVNRRWYGSLRCGLAACEPCHNKLCGGV